MNKWLWIALIPSFVFAEPSASYKSQTEVAVPFATKQQNPVYIDVEPDQLIIYPEKKLITARDLMLEGNEFEKFLDEMEPKKDSQSIVLLLRPGSAIFQRRLRTMIRDRGIDVGFEPWDAGREIPIQSPITTQTPKVEAPKSATITVTAEAEPIVVHPVNEKSIELDVRADSFTILPDGIVVTSDELETPGNPFELLLDEFEAKGDCPNIKLNPNPSGESLGNQLGALIMNRGEQMGCVMVKMTNQITVLVSTPKDLTGEDKTPVFFECRNQQLFSISPERLKIACDEKTAELRETVKENESEFLKSAATTVVELDGQCADFTYALLGKYVLTADENYEGYALGEDYLQETDDMWFGSQLAELDPEKQFLCFFVRPDSFKTFQRARALAGINDIHVSFEMMDDNDPIMIGPGSDRIFRQ